MVVRLAVRRVQARAVWELPGLPSLRSPLRAWLAQREPARPGLECPGLYYPGLGDPNWEGGEENLPCLSMHYQLLGVGRYPESLLEPINSYFQIYSIVPTDGTANAGRNPVVSPVLLRCFPGGKCPVPPC